MKLELNCKKNKLNFLKGKPKFLVSDLKKILNKLDDNVEINFGVLKNNNVIFTQEYNFIFDIHYQTRDDEMEENYQLNIITDHIEL